MQYKTIYGNIKIQDKIRQCKAIWGNTRQYNIIQEMARYDNTISAKTT